MYCGKSRDATIVLEAVASKDLWIWNCFFGMPGTLNDINVLQRSHLFAMLGNVVISKKFLHTRKIMVMHSNERGECCPRTLVDRKQKR